MQVPILYIVFNRPIETQRSFEVLRNIKPAILYIAADGARAHRPDDMVNTKAVRDIVSAIDWPCEVNTLFQPVNLGCRAAVEAALKWFFDNVEEGIILEDDIIPNKAFFVFCTAMLDKYRDDQQIFSVNGCSIGFNDTQTVYGLTKYFNMWGWATWRRSYKLVQQTWNSYDGDSVKDDAVVSNALRLSLPLEGNTLWLNHWSQIFTKIYHRQIDTWDYQWMYTVLKTGTFCIRPSQNYVINVGFGENATHHTFTKSPICNFKYTADEFTDKNDFTPTVNHDFEIEHVAKMVNAVPVKTRKEIIASYIPKSFKTVIKNMLKQKENQG